MNKHPADLSIPSGLNRTDKFKWLLGQLDVQEQRRVLEELCGTDDLKVPVTDRQKLLQMLGVTLRGPNDPS